MNTLRRRRDLDDLVRRLRTVRSDSAARWGRMSAHQMICHLVDGLRMATGERPVSAAAGPLQRTIVKWMALYLPVRWPAGFATRPEIDQVAGGGTPPVEFARDVAELEAFLERFASEQRTTWPLHPIFGRMSQQAWLRWAYLHADHHLRQFGA